MLYYAMVVKMKLNCNLCDKPYEIKRLPQDNTAITQKEIIKHMGFCSIRCQNLYYEELKSRGMI